MKRKFILMTCLLFLLSACTPPKIWMPRKGQVLDWETKEPIAGVVIIARWKGDIPIIPADFETTCYHVESAETDEQGYFRVPSYSDPHMRVVDKVISKRFYKVGYIESIDEKGYYRLYDREGLYYLERDASSREDRLKYIARMSRATGCNQAGESERNMYPFKKALYEEAKSLARTEEDKKIVNWLRFVAASVWVGLGEENYSEHDQRVQEFLEDNLK